MFLLVVFVSISVVCSVQRFCRENDLLLYLVGVGVTRTDRCLLQYVGVHVTSSGRIQLSAGGGPFFTPWLRGRRQLFLTENCWLHAQSVRLAGSVCVAFTRCWVLRARAR